MSGRAIIVAAPRSGAGKTTVTMALISACRARGIRVAAAKSGPDYIDPAFHAAASGEPCRNLDSWAMSPGLLDQGLSELVDLYELVIIEAATGLFDGVAGEAGRAGAAADLAARYAIPVLLVLDISGQAQSAAAVARGFATHDPAVRIAGVMLNRVGSERHRSYVAEAMDAARIPVLGAVMRDPDIALPERHLGLVQAQEHAALDDHIAALAGVAERSLDLNAIVALACEPVIGKTDNPRPALPPPGQRIAVARDDAFSFIYPHLIDGWGRAGAKMSFFSPLADEPPPSDCDMCWLPGGYPELHAAKLANAKGFLSGLRRFAEARPVHGECGGFMVLGEMLEDAKGGRHAMAGLLGHRTSFVDRKLHLGYRRAKLEADCAIGRAGTLIRGHEFHYTSVSHDDVDATFAHVSDGLGRPLGPAGGRRGRVTGSYFHAIAEDHDHQAMADTSPRTGTGCNGI